MRGWCRRTCKSLAKGLALATWRLNKQRDVKWHLLPRRQRDVAPEVLAVVFVLVWIVQGIVWEYATIGCSPDRLKDYDYPGGGESKAGSWIAVGRIFFRSPRVGANGFVKRIAKSLVCWMIATGCVELSLSQRWLKLCGNTGTTVNAHLRPALSKRAPARLQPNTGHLQTSTVPTALLLEVYNGARSLYAEQRGIPTRQAPRSEPEPGREGSEQKPRPHWRKGCGPKNERNKTKALGCKTSSRVAWKWVWSTRGVR